ncbi:unnamed protein product, partial [marine sediment metagenome]
MSKGKDFNFKTHIDLCDLPLHVKITDYHPHENPPYASHPDAPGHDNSGEPEEYGYQFFLLDNDGKEYPL